MRCYSLDTHLDTHLNNNSTYPGSLSTSMYPALGPAITPAITPAIYHTDTGHILSGQSTLDSSEFSITFGLAPLDFPIR